MYSAWLKFLTNQFELNDITQVLVYTDQDQFWLLQGFYDVFKQNNIPISTQFLDELSNEDGYDIQTSFEAISETTLIMAIFSSSNPSLSKINSVFPPLRQFVNYSGYSIVTIQEFQRQYFTDFLDMDFTTALDKKNRYCSEFGSNHNYQLVSQDLELQFELESKFFAFPFHTSIQRHVLFPATELIAEINPKTLNGKFTANGTIGPFYSGEHLQDPFGRIRTPITFTLDEGIIVDIQGKDRLVSRLNNIIELIENPEFTKIGMGIGPTIDLTGNIAVDKMINNTYNLSLGNRQLDILLYDAKIHSL